MSSIGFRNHLIQLNFNPKHFMQNYTYFRQTFFLSRMIKAEYIIDLRIYISCFFVKNKAPNHLNFCHQLLGLTLGNKSLIIKQPVLGVSG